MNASSSLRPMGLRDILDESFSFYKDNFALFFGISATVFLPYQLLLGAQGESGLYFPGSPSLGPGALMRFVQLLARFCVCTLPIGALIAAFMERRLGRATTILEAYGNLLERFFPFLSTLLLALLAIGFGLSTLLFFCLTVSLAFAAFIGSDTDLLYFVIPTALLVGAFYVFLFAFVLPAFIMEEKTGFSAIRRSFELILGDAMKILGATALVGILAPILMTILAFPISFILYLCDANDQKTLAGGMICGAVNGCIQALVHPIPILVFALLYVDIRIRREGYDLEVMASEMRRASPPAGAEPAS